MTLIATVLSLAFEGQGGTLPAQAGGLSGLLGAGAIQAVAARFGADAEGWVILGLALTSLAVGVGLLTRIFAIDWRVLMSLPEFLGGGSLAGLLRRRPEAIVVTGGKHTDRSRRLLANAGIPVIETWDLPSDPLGHVVGFSNADAVRGMVDHFVSKGLSRIAFIEEPRMYGITVRMKY